MGIGINISVSGLRKSYARGQVQALDGVDLEVPPGEWLAITGATGSGKSTLLSLLAMLEQPDDGTILFDGTPTASLKPPEDWRAANLGIVFQFHHLLPHLTLLENTLLPLAPTRIKTKQATEIAEATLERVGIRHRAMTRAALVSGGERQMAAVARALVAGPRLILADEPTGNVDSKSAERIVEVLAGWSREDQGTLVMVTHNDELAARADRSIRIQSGRVA